MWWRPGGRQTTGVPGGSIEAMSGDARVVCGKHVRRCPGTYQEDQIQRRSPSVFEMGVVRPDPFEADREPCATMAP